jgi:Fe2+ or Zn2+ uptake regulation protein
MELLDGPLDQLGISRQGMYNVLNDLARAGLLRCIEPAGSAARYEMRVGDNHHHLVCRACGGVQDVDCTVGHAPCLQPTGAAGFTVQEAEVTWWGLCERCAADDPAVVTPADPMMKNIHPPKGTCSHD